MTNPGEFAHSRPYPPELVGVVSRMEQILASPSYNHAAVPTQVAVDSMRHGMVASFAGFEHCLRDVGSRVHFVAVPLDFFGQQYRSVYPVNRLDEAPEHTLYVVMNGEGEAQELLGNLGVMQAQNLEHLVNT
ncbi:hypothetical protein KDA14_02940, partial [Candidatus Saccharibacteria bacterium]|nr:hypothetical protein [Candidatus Saccharibacteria bacterium]